MTQPIIETRQLAAGYNGKALLEGVSVSVRPGQVVTLIGPNGAGKTTLLKTLAGLIPPVEGSISICGQDLGQMEARQAASYISVVMTRPPDPELMSAFEVAAAGRYPFTGTFGMLSDEDRKKTMAAMEMTGTAHLAGSAFTTLSDGQKQRVMLARAICQEPKVMILDEPASFLDIRHKLALLKILEDLAGKEKLAVIMSLHELDLAMKISDMILCVRNGHIERAGAPEEIFKDDFIRCLYELETGSFLSGSGSLELSGASGGARAFVIGGGGSGFALYRRLQRLGIPFEAGILPENDVELPAASALAVSVITGKAFEAFPDELMQSARDRITACGRVIIASTDIDKIGAQNASLAGWASDRGIIVTKELPKEWADGI